MEAKLALLNVERLREAKEHVSSREWQGRTVGENRIKNEKLSSIGTQRNKKKNFKKRGTLFFIDRIKRHKMLKVDKEKLYQTRCEKYSEKKRTLKKDLCITQVLLSTQGPRQY